MKQLPKNLKPKATDTHRVVLAYGEVTGHAHAFNAPEKIDLFESTDINETKTFIQVKEIADLTHEEHTTHTIAPGIGEVIRQTEWSLDGVRRVAD